MKILRAKSLTKTRYCSGSRLGFSGDTPIDLNRERLQASWRALEFREKALDSTPSARIVELASGKPTKYIFLHSKILPWDRKSFLPPLPM